MSYFVYFIKSTNESTYIGATVDLDKRIRQHNKEIKGGAYATGAKVAKGEIWIRACHVEGFPDWTSALQFEWRWKQLTRKVTSTRIPLERRIVALKQLLSLERPTSKAMSYSEWPQMPIVVLEDDEARTYYGIADT